MNKMESSSGPLSSSQEQSSPYLFIHLLEQIFVVLSYLELEKFVTVSNSWLTQRPLHMLRNWCGVPSLFWRIFKVGKGSACLLPPGIASLPIVIAKWILCTYSWTWYTAENCQNFGMWGSWAPSLSISGTSGGYGFIPLMVYTKK